MFASPTARHRLAWATLSRPFGAPLMASSRDVLHYLLRHIKLGDLSQSFPARDAIDFDHDEFSVLPGEEVDAPHFRADGLRRTKGQVLFTFRQSHRFRRAAAGE